ncbi:MAG TPA: aldehyde dehydrogenase family protein, partial [Mycobacterium sp.]|nr:aldehyde dehydrogenase family protein [Mycobacterium sp.]
MSTPDIERLLASVPTGLWIGGEERPATSTYDVLDPSNDEVLTKVGNATAADAIAALDAACAVQAEWAATPPRERGEILRSVFETIIERTDELAALMTLEMGKVFAESQGEVKYGAEFFRWFAEEAVRIGGRYTQAPSTDDLSPSTGDPELPVTSSWSGALGLDATIARRLELGVDGWYRSVSDAVVEVPGEVPTTADGYAWGVELTSRYRLRERFFFGAWAAVGHAERGGAPFDYDQPYAGSVLGSWDFKPGWNAGLRYRVAAGLPYTPVADSVY